MKIIATIILLCFCQNVLAARQSTIHNVVGYCYPAEHCMILFNKVREQRREVLCSPVHGAEHVADIRPDKHEDNLTVVEFSESLTGPTSLNRVYMSDVDSGSIDICKRPDLPMLVYFPPPLPEPVVPVVEAEEQ